MFDLLDLHFYCSFDGLHMRLSNDWRRIYNNFLRFDVLLRFLLVKLPEFLRILLHTHNRNVPLDLVFNLRYFFLLGYDVGWLCLFGRDWRNEMERVA